MSQTRRKSTAVLVFIAAGFFLAAPAVRSAAPSDAAQKNLADIYSRRADLQAVFRPDGTAVKSGANRELADLAAWAAAYGHKEHPELLAEYRPRKPPRALVAKPKAPAPARLPGRDLDFSSINARAVIVVDAASRRTLFEKNAGLPWPIASITKLSTALVAIDRKLPMNRTVYIKASDEVGGARLRAATGAAVSANGLFYAMLVGSANNAANAVARATGLSRAAFVKAMNAKARALGLSDTKFADPSGIEPGNVSTAEDVAALGFEAFSAPLVRKATTTSAYTVLVSARRRTEPHIIKNTDTLLTDQNNGIIVLGGKTGYLEESKWNFVAKFKDKRNRPLVVVVLGSDTRAQSFKDARAVAEWVWSNYSWKK